MHRPGEFLVPTSQFNPQTLMKLFDSYYTQVIRLLLNGPSAIRTGRRSSKSRRPHAQMWHIRVVTPSLIAFATTVVRSLTLAPSHNDLYMLDQICSVGGAKLRRE